MSVSIGPVCDRCGNCCDGYVFWMENRSYDDTKGYKELAEYHGLQTKRRADGTLGIRKPGPCSQFEIKDGKATCKIHDNKPGVCKDFFCDKAKALGEKLKEIANGVRI